ncbi:localization factor PodJL [Devosia sp. UYZn731]|uniref:peptidoglycan-binding protein n=1 Tax=Devosia sp. UYZn731 TaxID=3156345 RepID=UPI00339A85CF
MARAFPISDNTDADQDLNTGDWQALRGELVALLDQVEGRYARTERVDPALEGLSQRVRSLRDQVGGTPEPSARRREALRTVKRAVDRFSDRDETEDMIDADTDQLRSAIAEIRSRQFSAPAAALGRRATDMPEFRELNALVGGLSGRLERLEGDLKSQRASNGSVREVANQVEQLTHVVELLAGAVGETGQVKRLEAQIAALARMIGDAPKVDLSTINKRLDDVSATVGKLAELQASQMEREIVREDRADALPAMDEALAPAMTSIEKSVRNVYDRIDSIEKNLALSSGDFERLTSEMAGFTQAMRDREAMPGTLMSKVDALADRIGGFETANGDVAGLKKDILALRNAVMSGMEPRFSRIESQLDALSEKLAAPGSDAGTGQIESQLKLLMSRMDETGAQLDGLAKLYSTHDEPAAQPDYNALAAMVAERTSLAVAKSNAAAPAPVMTDATVDVFEKRMSALLNTAGKDTAERLARLETALTQRQERPFARLEAAAIPPEPDRPARAAASNATLDDMLHALDRRSTDVPARSDAMPANPADDAPLTDPGFKDAGPVRTALEAKNGPRKAHPAVTAEAVIPAVSAKPIYDPNAVERPPQPQSSFASAGRDPFAPEPERALAQVQAEAPLNQTSTSTFVAAARRAQRAKQDTQASATDNNSLISKALSRVMPPRPNGDAPVEPTLAPAEVKRPKPVKEPKAAKAPKQAKPAPEPMLDADGVVIEQQSFLARHRRPLLLAAVLVATSMLALNLVLQRVAPANSPTPPQAVESVTEPAVPAPAPLNAAPASDTDSGDLGDAGTSSDSPVDSLAVGSIGSRVAMTFATPETTPMPSALMAKGEAGQITSIEAPDQAAPETTASIPATPAAPVTFELAPEAVGPIELRQAAANGDARAQFEIGAIYTEGRALAQDYKAAATWYERAAAQGFVPAEYRLGNLYEVGNGVDKDLDIAKLWYQRGAEAGNRMAMHNLAALYASGQLGDQQFETAAEWFERAANLGMTDSQFNLGMLYARGLGVDQNMEQSYKWFSLAARTGDADASKARDDMARSLTADVVKRLNDEIAAWTSQPIDLAANFAPIGTWSATFSPGDTIKTKEVVSRVQTALAKLGYDIGTPDGLAGPKTADAIKAFERGTGMTESGAINPRLLAVLGSQPV